MADIRDEQIFESWKRELLQQVMPQDIRSYYEFMGSWIMFNSVYRQDGQVRGGAANLANERVRVESFAAPDAFGNIHTSLMANDNEYALAVQFISGRNPPPAPPRTGAFSHADVRVWNLGKRTLREKQGLCTGDTDLAGLLGCLYVIRCNLFHGDKLVGNHSDITLVANAYGILSKLLLGYALL